MNLIGNHGCIKTPASLFNENGTMRAAGTKASLVKILREETCVTAVPNLPHQNLKTAVCRWSFLKDETAATGISADWHTERHRQHTFLLRQVQSYEPEVSRATACMPGRNKLSNLRSVSITQSPTNKSYSLYLPTRPDFLNFLCERCCDVGQLGGGFKDEMIDFVFYNLFYF